VKVFKNLRVHTNGATAAFMFTDKLDGETLYEANDFYNDPDIFPDEARLREEIPKADDN